MDKGESLKIFVVRNREDKRDAKDEDWRTFGRSFDFSLTWMDGEELL